MSTPTKKGEVVSEALSSPAQPATLWEYYKACKASGFLSMLPMLTMEIRTLLPNPRAANAYANDPRVVEYRRLTWDQRRMVPADPNYAHLWVVYVDHLYTRCRDYEHYESWKDIRKRMILGAHYHLQPRKDALIHLTKTTI